jgi:hypothetical protein
VSKIKARPTGLLSALCVGIGDFSTKPFTPESSTSEPVPARKYGNNGTRKHRKSLWNFLSKSKEAILFEK